MSIKYACFISYAHGGQGQLVSKFVSQLKDALDTYLDPYLREKAYLDEDRLSPGFSYNEALAESICESVCMIVVYSPTYEGSTYCMRELLGMERLEEKRKKILGPRYDRKRRMIIPIILRGDLMKLPPKIKDIQYYDFSKFELAGRPMEKNRNYSGTIDKIAKYIYEYYTDLKQLGIVDENDGNCTKFILPSEHEITISCVPSSWERKFPGIQG